nr:hypothetical protein [Schaalia odontolytica]
MAISTLDEYLATIPNGDNGELADSFLEEFRRSADNPTPGHPFEQLNEQLKQAVRDYEANPDEVSTLDEVKAELGLD